MLLHFTTFHNHPIWCLLCKKFADIQRKSRIPEKSVSLAKVPRNSNETKTTIGGWGFILSRNRPYRQQVPVLPTRDEILRATDDGSCHFVWGCLGTLSDNPLQLPPTDLKSCHPSGQPRTHPHTRRQHFEEHSTYPEATSSKAGRLARNSDNVVSVVRRRLGRRRRPEQQRANPIKSSTGAARLARPSRQCSLQRRNNHTFPSLIVLCFS